MCGPLKRQVVYYTMCLLNYRTFLQNNTSLVSIIAPSCGVRWATSHVPYILIICWTGCGPQLSSLDLLVACVSVNFCTGSAAEPQLCMCVCVCVFPNTFFPRCMSVCKSVCGPFLCKIWNTHTVSLTLLLICSQHSGGGLGPVEEELGRRSWGSPKVLLKGNSSGFSPPLNSCHLLDAHT